MKSCHLFDKTHTYTSSVTTVGCQLRNCHCNGFPFSPPKGPSPRVGILLSQDAAASAFPATPHPSIRRALPEMSSKSESSGLEGEPRHLSVVGGGEHLGSDGDAGVRDAVFGNLTEKGPNYRNASFSRVALVVRKKKN